MTERLIRLTVALAVPAVAAVAAVISYQHACELARVGAFWLRGVVSGFRWRLRGGNG
jgi:hypothetical protein